jgi:hypothetical protein
MRRQSGDPTFSGVNRRKEIAMINQDHQQTALLMIELHGLQARAIAQQHLLEQRQKGDAAGIERWQDIHAAIGMLRRTHQRERSGSRSAAV